MIHQPENAPVPIIEIDGDSHYEVGAQEHDHKRDAFLREKGFTLLRLSNRKVLEDMDGIMQYIVGLLEAWGSPSPSLAMLASPSPAGRGNVRRPM